MAVLLLSVAGCSMSGTSSRPMGGEGSHSAPPPPPPPPSPAAPVSGADEVSASASKRVESGEPTSERIMPETPPAKPQPPAQSGLLTAGDYDDLLNPGLYADYVGRYLQEQRDEAMPYVDTGRAVSVRVVGKDGAPAAFSKVSVKRANGETLTLTTPANGTAVFFPAFDKLPPDLDLTVTAPGAVQDLRRRVTARDIQGDRQLTVTLDRAAEPVKKLDLMLVIDTTGSMGDELNYLKVELADILRRVSRNNPGVDIRVGLIVYRDIGDEYVVRSFPLTGDAGALQADLKKQTFDGGGDYPEAMEQAMAKAVTQDWREKAARVVLLVADAPPHDDKIQPAWTSAVEARRQSVQIVPLAASGVADKAEFLMRAMAALTQGRYLFLTDDSGVGNAHAEPKVDCYVVTRLDGLVSRVISGLVSGKRIEPSKDEVVRKVGNYDNGVCKVSLKQQ